MLPCFFPGSSMNRIQVDAHRTTFIHGRSNTCCFFCCKVRHTVGNLGSGCRKIQRGANHNFSSVSFPVTFIIQDWELLRYPSTSPHLTSSPISLGTLLLLSSQTSFVLASSTVLTTEQLLSTPLTLAIGHWPLVLSICAEFPGGHPSFLAPTCLSLSRVSWLYNDGCLSDSPHRDFTFPPPPLVFQRTAQLGCCRPVP